MRDAVRAQEASAAAIERERAELLGRREKLSRDSGIAATARDRAADVFAASERDEQWDLHGIKVVCDHVSHQYLTGVNIDFKDEVMGRGFVFNNPNATHTCGCGSSFSA